MVPDVPNWLFSTCAFISFLLCMIPLPWHLEGNFIVLQHHMPSNVPPSLEYGHLLVHDMDGLGSVKPIRQFRRLEFGRHHQGPSLVRHLWVSLRFFLLSGFSHHSRAATQFMTASSVAIPAASLCINRRLYHIASVQSVTTTRAQKRRDIIVDLAIGVGLPIVVTIIRECYGRNSSGIGADLPIDFCFQSNRFILMEEIGCYPFTFNTPLAYPFYFCVPLVIGLVSATYCCTCARNASQ